MPIKVLIVDDFALVRTQLTEVINSQPDMTVVGTAPDGCEACDWLRLSLIRDKSLTATPVYYHAKLPAIAIYKEARP
jgi:hypothetical protein